jgi:hypothetical protein
MRRHPTMERVCLIDGRLFLELAVSKDEDGYYYVSLPGGAKERLHRLLWEVYSGRPIPEGLQVRHLNDVRTDNREENLALGTHGDNMRDRRDNGLDPIGSKNSQAKLTEPQVKAIRKRAKKGDKPAVLAGEYGVSLSTVRGIIRGDIWKHVE